MSSGTNFFSSITFKTFVVNSGTVTSVFDGLPSSSKFSNICVCFGMVIVAPCILDFSPPSAIDNVKASGSGDAKKFRLPLRAKIGGKFAENPLLNLKSSLKNNTSAANLFFGAWGIPSGFCWLPVTTGITTSLISLRISAELLAKTFTVVVIGVSTILGLTFSSASIVGFL